MVNSRRKSLINLRGAFFLCLAIILTACIAANIILSLNQDKIIQNLNNRFFKPVSLKNIFYLPPNIIILKGLSISEDKLKPDKKIFSIPVSMASFSLSSLFFNRDFQVRSFYCIGITVNSNELFSFVKENFTQILDFIIQLPREDFALTMRQIRLAPPKKESYPFNNKGSFNLKIKGKLVSFSGAIRENNFSFKGLLDREQMNVENFKLVNNNINCQLWGKLAPSLAELKGFILTNNLNPPGKSASVSLAILDLDSRIKFAFGRLEIERLNFSINNNPVELTADMLLSKPFSCNLKLSSNFRSLDNQKESRLKKIMLTASAGAQEGQAIKVNAALNIDFPEHKKDSLPLEKFDLNLKDLVISFKDPTVLKLNAAALNLFSKTSTNLYNINLEDLNTAVYGLNKALKLVKFSSRFYSGQLEGKAQLSMREFMPAILAVIKAKNVDANKLEGILIHFSKAYGKLSSQMFFINYPQLIFRGSLNINNGYLDNFEFLKWLAKIFNLPSLKKISFDTASSYFIADKEGAGLYNMDLDSKNLKIKGYFRLKENDMVASKISLCFGRKLLQESDKLAPILKLLDKKQDVVKFNYQLSGNLHAMNFQWLKSDFKDGLQRAIPNFAKRNLENKIEGLIESISEE